MDPKVEAEKRRELQKLKDEYKRKKEALEQASEPKTLSDAMLKHSRVFESKVDNNGILISLNNRPHFGGQFVIELGQDLQYLMKDKQRFSRSSVFTEKRIEELTEEFATFLREFSPELLDLKLDLEVERKKRRDERKARKAEQQAA